MRHIESHIQQVCLRWARMQFPVCRELMFSVPNGAHLSMVQAKILKAEGMTAGVADMLLLRPSADGRYAALAIEFKTAKGKQSTYQKAWQTELEKPGCYRYEVVRSFEQFRDLINNYLREVEEPAEGIRGNLEEIPSNVDLEKEIQRYLCEECSSDDEPTIAEIARHFYELGLKARKEE